MMKKYLFSWGTAFLCLLVSGLLLLTSGKEKPEKIHDADGPYILYREDGSARVVTVGLKGELKDKTYKTLPSDFSFPVMSHKGNHRFQVTLHPFERPQWRMPQADSMLVISDPHGNLDCFVSVLKNNGVINDRYEWTFGKNQLVIIGDVFDRGKDVLPIFWLIYKLEKEAADSGGQALFMLGNHEEMVLRGDLRYVKEKYKALADTLHMPYQDLWKEDSELGRWLRTRNLIGIVGDNLIVHAGLSADFLEREEDIPAMNEEIGKYLSLDRKGRTEASPLSAFVYDTKTGPFWYRGMVYAADRYQPVGREEVVRLLDKFGVSRVLVGHTIFDDVFTFHQRRIISVNVDNKENMEKGRGRGILIVGKDIFVIYDRKQPQPLR